MDRENYRICKLGNADTIPFELLLLADESKHAIEKYIYDSTIYTLYVEDNCDPLAVFALYKISNSTIEIKNIAVAAPCRNQRIGSFLIGKIKEIAGADGCKEIIVGTPATGIREIRFYERNGFEKYGVKKNFFVENYSEPIIEEGVVLRDMVMLKTKLV